MLPRIPTLVLSLTALSLVQGHAQTTSPARLDSSAARPLAKLPYTPSLDRASMDVTADPCVDFYQYACGGWMTGNPIPPDQPRWDVYAKLASENQQFLWGLLDEAARAPADTRTPSQQRIGDYFAACMDEGAIERAGTRPLRQSLDAVSALRSTREIARFLGEAHLTSGDAGLGFDFSSGQDFENSSEVIAFADAGGLGLPDRDYYLKTDPKSVELRARYLAHVRRMFELVGVPHERTRAGAEAVVRLETALAKASLTRVDRRDPYKLFHRMDRRSLSALTPAFDWDTYLAAQGVPGITVVNLTEPAFFREFNRLLTAEPLDHWKSYLRWHLVRERARYLSKALADADFDFYRRTLRGVTEQQPRWKKCVQWVDRDLGEALGQVFVARTFSAETKARTLEMARLVEEGMADEIRQLPWMGEATRRRALEKLAAIVNKIGYPDRWRDYSSLDIVRDDFFGNVSRAIAFESRRQLAKIGKPLDRGEWDMTPPTVNAYYNAQLNDINFPAGVLQPPLYDPSMDDAPNYGNTGGTIGHELTHGFDDAGRQFDAKGNLKDWWTPEDAKGFQQRIQCLQDQFAQYVVVDDIRINSKLTAGEDVADLGGTLLAYLAWKKATAAQDLKSIDGFTPDQRFFIGFAQWACENNRPENQRLHAATDPHSPGKYRINGIVSNLPEFERAFSCQPGQPMAKADKCKVW
jgi:endothelin-converting enzyme/putative endopeptidase